MFPFNRHHFLTDFEVVVRIFNMMDKVFNIGYFTHYVRYRTDCNVGNIQAATIIEIIVVIFMVHWLMNQSSINSLSFCLYLMMAVVIGKYA